jgi:16S rRNA (guanine527-N7)-methyltransferase
MFHVKHSAERQESSNRETLAEQADAHLRALGIEIGRGELLLCCDFLLGILDANERVNLTAIRDLASALRLHLVDSLAAATRVRQAPEGDLCDIGSGGGFPGTPLCIATARPGALIDSARRKVDAVSQVLLETRVQNVRAMHARVEEYALENRGRFAVVTSRAVAELPVLVEYAAPLLVPGGTFLALKGSPSPEEVDRGVRAAEFCGLSLRSREHYLLPGGLEARELLAFERTGEPSVALPRSTGRAVKRPLS